VFPPERRRGKRRTEGRKEEVRDDGAGAREKGGAFRGEEEPIYLQCKESEIQNHCFQNWQPLEEEQHATTSFTSTGILTHSYNQHTVTHSCIETQPHSHTHKQLTCSMQRLTSSPLSETETLSEKIRVSQGHKYAHT